MNKRKIGFALLLVFVAVVPTFAFLGLGDIVFDPSVFEESVQQLVQLEQQYEQLRQTYTMVQSQYQQMVWMANQVPVSMINRYKALSAPWTRASATNTYGTTGAWISSVNNGQGVAGAYAASTEPLSTYGPALSNIPGGQVDRMKTNYATLELSDGANVSALQTIGQLRANAPGVASAIGSLEADSLSSDPAMNTEIAVLNKINAANVIALRSGQDTNQLLVALAEQQTIQVKRDRDAAARAFNQHVQFMTEGQKAMSAQSADASAAMIAWRMP